MRFQQTSKSAHGAHGPRAEGLHLPGAQEIARRVGREAMEAQIEEHHPGLQEVLTILKGLMGAGSVAVSRIPQDKLASAAANGGELDQLAVTVHVTATTFQGVQVLHDILSRGLEDALDEGSNAVCKHCDEVVFYRKPSHGTDGMWLHLETGKALCADRANVARKRRRSKHVQ